MRGPRMLIVAALVAFAAFQVLLGCNGKPTHNKEKVIHLKRNGPKGWETHHRATANDVITWKASDKFYVVFKAGYNPCGKDTFGDPTANVDVYNSKQVGGNHYEAQCTVNNPNVPTPWEFGVGDGSYPPPPPPHGKEYVPPPIPCDGCRADEGSYPE